jgi:hypothetical protein
MIESFHFIPGEVCSFNSSVVSSVPLTLKSCLDQLGALGDVSAAIAPNFVISEDAIAYADSLKSFLWDSLLPATITTFGLFSVPKILKSMRI